MNWQSDGLTRNGGNGQENGKCALILIGKTHTSGVETLLPHQE